MTHHPHVHMIVPGGGIALDGSRWISSRPPFLRHLKPVRSKRWVVYAKTPFAGPEAVPPISRVTPTGSRSRTVA